MSGTSETATSHSGSELIVNSTATVWLHIGFPLMLVWLGYALYSGDAHAFMTEVYFSRAETVTRAGSVLESLTSSSTIGGAFMFLGTIAAIGGFAAYQPDKSVAGPTPNATAAAGTVFFPMLYILMAIGAGHLLSSWAPPEFATSAGALGFVGVTALAMPGHLFFLVDTNRSRGDS